MGAIAAEVVDALEAEKRRVLVRARRGRVYLGEHDESIVDSLAQLPVDELGEIQPRAGYRLVGRGPHEPDATGTLVVRGLAEWEPEWSPDMEVDSNAPQRRALVLSTVHRPEGPVHVGTFAPCAAVDVGVGRRLLLQPRVEYVDGHGFSLRTMFGGPGWMKIMERAGVQL